MMFAVSLVFKLSYMMSGLNILFLFKYINGKMDFKCTYHVDLHGLLQN